MSRSKTLRNGLINKSLYLVECEGRLLLLSREGKQQDVEKQNIEDDHDDDGDNDSGMEALNTRYGGRRRFGNG